MTSKYKYIFGPVPSRRFGRSLGIDLVPLKTCTLSCVFCQLGRTEHTTTERKEYVPAEEVVREIQEWAEEGRDVDYITLSGSGEPTLHSRFGEILECANLTDRAKTALLTNGTLLHLPEVREQASHADVVKVTLSAWDQDSFERIHQPAPGVTFDQLVKGQRALRAEYEGEIWMEVFILAGMNSADQDVEQIAALAETIKPDRIHINTAVRPAAETYAKPVERSHLQHIRDLLGPRAEVIAEFTAQDTTPFQLNEREILAMLQRRPCTAQQIADVFTLDINEVAKYLGMLMEKEQIREEIRNDRKYFIGVKEE